MSDATEASSSELTDNDAIACRLSKHRSEISKYINPNELFNCMCEEGLVEMELLGIINDHNKTRETKVQAILKAVESNSNANAFVQFAECVKNDSKRTFRALLHC